MKRILTVCCAVGALLGAADETPNWEGRIRRDHPRMFFNAETWPQVKARAEGPARAARDALIKRCDGYPADPVCSGFDPVVFREVKTASGTHKTTAATPIPSVKEWGPQAAECALAWRFTGERKYLEKARKMLAASVAAYHAAYRNGRAVNWYSTTRILALCAYDWIWEALTPEERKAIIVPLVQHVEDVQPGKGKPFIIRRNVGNIQSGFYSVRSLLWYSGLAAYGDGFCDDLARDQLRRGHDLCLEMVKFRNDGARRRRPLLRRARLLHGRVPVGALQLLPHLALRHRREPRRILPRARPLPQLDLLDVDPERGPSEHAALLRFRRRPAHAQHPVGWPPLRAHVAVHPLLPRREPRRRAPRRVAARPRAQPVVRERLADVPVPFRSRSSATLSAPRAPQQVEEVKPYSAEELENQPLHARHFENLGQIIMRSGWKPDSTYCTFTAGAKLTMHKHHDENNFTIYKHDFLALDSGTRGVETDWNLKYYYAQTIAHNCILIRRPGEPLPRYWGPVYPGPEGKNNDGGMYDGSAKVLAFETNDAYTYIASDATALYGKKCTEAVRQFVHLLPDVFVVYDRVGAATPSDAKAWLLHVKDEPAVEGRVLRADSGKGRLFCETILPEDATLEKIGGPGKEFWSNGKNWEPDTAFLASAARGAKRTGRGPYFGAWRLEVAPGAPRANDRFLHVLTATDSTATRPQVQRIATEAHDGVEIVLPDGRRAEVKFNRTGAVGGTIAINGAARAFATAIQPQSGIIIK